MSLVVLGLLSFLNLFTKSDSTTQKSRELFSKKLDSLQQSKTLESGFLGVSIRNCSNQENIIDFNGKKALKPASTLKLVTTATALGILGESYRFETTLGYTGQIRGDTLFGNIIIKGGGDPTLGSWRFDETLDYSRLFLDWATLVSCLIF